MTAFWFPSPHGLTQTSYLTSRLDLSELASRLDYSVYCSGNHSLNAPGTNYLCAHAPGPVVFTPERGVCHVNTVPDGAVSLPAWLCSYLQLLLIGSPLLCARHPPRAPGPRRRALLRARMRPARYQTTRCGVVHVRDPVASGLTAGKALSCLARAYRKVLHAFAVDLVRV